MVNGLSVFVARMENHGFVAGERTKLIEQVFVGAMAQARVCQSVGPIEHETAGALEEAVFLFMPLEVQAVFYREFFSELVE
jgi:hypothetical protein